MPLVRGDRITIIIHEMTGGGVERMMARLASGLSDIGLQVEVVAFNISGKMAAEFPQHVNLVELKKRSVIGKVKEFHDHICRYKPDYIISAVQIPNFVAFWSNFFALSTAKVVLTQRGMGGEPCDPASGIKAKLFRVAIRFAYRHADAVVAISKAVASELETQVRVPRRRLHIIYNPVMTKELHAKYAERGDHPWFSDHRIPIILGVGRLSVEKGFDTLIAAVSRVAANRKVRLIIVGDGQERERLQKLVVELKATQFISLVGYRDNPFAYMSKASLFVLPSLTEGFGNVLVEALGAGIPIVSSDCPGGPREILADGQYGILVPPRDSKVLAAAIETALDSETSPEILKSRAAQFSAGRSVSQYVRLLESLS